MLIEKYVLGPIATNTYVLSIGNKAIVIDPASKAEKMIEILKDKELLAILLTHGHFDHIKAVDGLYEKYKCDTYIHLADEELARDKNSGSNFGLTAYISTPLKSISEGKHNIGPFNFEVIYTPGHTEGSIIYVFENDIFTGDTLFKGSVGRTDLKGGNSSKLRESLRIFKQFNKDYIIHPGHEEETTLYNELKYNYYLR